MKDKYRMSPALIGISVFLVLVFLWPVIGTITGAIKGAGIGFLVAFILLEITLLILLHQMLRYYIFNGREIKSGLPFLKPKVYSVDEITEWYYQEGINSNVEIIFVIKNCVRLRMPLSGRKLREKINELVDHLRDRATSKIISMLNTEGLDVIGLRNKTEFRITNQGIVELQGGKFYSWRDLKDVRISSAGFDRIFHVIFMERDFYFAHNMGSKETGLVEYLIEKKEEISRLTRR